MDDPRAFYEQCPICGQFTDWTCCGINDLKPCPFCGKSDQLQFIDGKYSDHAYVQCMFCGAAGSMWNITPGTDKNDADVMKFIRGQARSCWNMRTIQQ